MYQVAEVKNHQGLQVFIDELKFIDGLKKKKIEELKAKAEKEFSELSMRNKAAFEKIENYCRENNLFKEEFSRDTHHFSLDTKHNVLLVHENDRGGMPAGLRAIIEGFSDDD